MDKIDIQMTNMDKQITKIDARVTKIEDKITHMDTRITKIEVNISNIKEDIMDIKALLVKQSEKISGLEKMKYRLQGIGLALSAGIGGAGVILVIFG